MPVAAQLTYKFKVEVDGSPLTPDVEAALLSAVVDDNLHLPDVFQLAFRDPARDVLDRTGVRIGSEVRVKVFSADDPTGEPLIIGEVTAVEAVLDRQGTTTVIRGSDRSHRLQRGRITEAYTDVTYGDVALQVADRLGLKSDVEQTTPVFDHVAQVAESDWSFLWRLARSIGFEVVVLDGTLHFRRPERSAAGPGSTTLAGVDPLTLTYGADLIRLTASVTSGEQVEEVEVRSWDLVQKDAVVGRAPAATDSATIGTTPSELAGRFGGGTYVFGRSSPIDPGQADAVATAVAEQIGSTFAELDGTARGNPRLRAGVAVSLSLIGSPFDGKYTVTRSRHVYDPLEGYLVDFSVSGRQDRSLLGATATDGPSTRFLGVVIGLVSDVRDPEGLGRVKLTFPWLSETFESGWARVSSAGAGSDRGFVVVPEVDDEVLVAFEDGDPSFPYVLGGLWNGRDKPPQHQVDGSKGDVRTRTFRTREGSVLTFDDDDGSIRLATPGEQTVVVLTETGASTLQITTSGDTAITSDGNVEVKAARSLSLKADQAIEIAATTSLTLSGAKVDISGDGPVAVSGTPIQLN